MKINEDLGYLYINETTSPDDSLVKNINVFDSNSIFYVEFEACFHSFDVMNRNSRIYKAANVMSCLQTDRIQSYLKHGGWYGEMNHPISRYENMKLSPDRIQDIDMGNTSHRLLNPHLKGNLLISKAQTDSGTAAGKNLASKMVQGFIPSFSCRSIATMMLESGKPIVNVRKVIAYDWVLYQSHVEADQIEGSPTNFISKSPNQQINESVNNLNITIPLKDILSDISKSDVNTQVVMESFGLDNDDLVGFSKNKKHVLIKDENNMIYCNIDHNSRKKVNDFFNSFDRM